MRVCEFVFAMKLTCFPSIIPNCKHKSFDEFCLVFSQSSYVRKTNKRENY